MTSVDPYTQTVYGQARSHEDVFRRIEQLAEEVLPRVQRLIAEHQAVKLQLAKAMDLLAEYGWEPFGTHANDEPTPRLTFSPQTGEDGLPLFERVVYGTT